MGDNPNDKPGEPAGNKAPSDFARYQAGRGGPSPGMVLGWAMPPSFAHMPQTRGGHHEQAFPASAPAATASLADSLGTTVQLGFGLLNALLSSSASALAGMTAMAQGGSHPGGSSWHGHGCGCESCCGQDCCSTLSCSCCRPSVNGCC